GTLGTDAVYEWSELSDFSILEVETGASIVRSPIATTTYYVRINGPAPCAYPSAAQSATVTVSQPATAPTSLDADPAAVCSTSPDVELTVVGGTLGSGEYVLYDDDPTTIGVELDRNITGVFNVTVTETTTYYARIESSGTCPFTTSVSVTVDYNVTSV